LNKPEGTVTYSHCYNYFARKANTIHSSCFCMDWNDVKRGNTMHFCPTASSYKFEPFCGRSSVSTRKQVQAQHSDMWHLCF